jgi:hypothetical protein
MCQWVINILCIIYTIYFSKIFYNIIYNLCTRSRIRVHSDISSASVVAVLFSIGKQLWGSSTVLEQRELNLGQLIIKKNHLVPNYCNNAEGTSNFCFKSHDVWYANEVKLFKFLVIPFAVSSALYRSSILKSYQSFNSWNLLIRIPKRSLNDRCTLTTDSLVFTNASYANRRQTTLYCVIVTIKSYYLTYRISLSRPIPTYIQLWKKPVYYFPIPPSIYVIITFLPYFILAMGFAIIC